VWTRAAPSPAADAPVFVPPDRLYTTKLLCKDSVVNEAGTQALARTFMALADPTRVAIVARLAGGDATVKELTEPFALTQQAVSRHLKVLEEAGLVSRRKAAQARPASLEVERLVEVLSWIDARRREWVDRHNRLEQHLRRLGGKRR
jgi:DNA-binding transcriptional ArsR family regulator